MPIREVVSQISPPIRILLVLAVAVLGAYMLFLRPKPEEIPPVDPAGTSTSQPGQVRDAAEDAVDAANDQLAQQESVDGVDAGESAAGTQAGTKKAQPGKAQAGATAEPAQDLKGLPKPIRQAIRSNKILVVPVLERQVVRRQGRRGRAHEDRQAGTAACTSTPRRCARSPSTAASPAA